MILTEYNEAQHIEGEKNISREEGLAEGLIEGQEKERTKNILATIRAGISMDKVMEIFCITNEEYKHYASLL